MLRLGVLLAVGAFLACVGYYFNADNLIGFRHWLTVAAIVFTCGTAVGIVLLWHWILSDLKKTEAKIIKTLQERYHGTNRTDSL